MNVSGDWFDRSDFTPRRKTFSLGPVTTFFRGSGFGPDTLISSKGFGAGFSFKRTKFGYDSVPVSDDGAHGVRRYSEKTFYEKRPHNVCCTLVGARKAVCTVRACVLWPCRTIVRKVQSLPLVRASEAAPGLRADIINALATYSARTGRNAHDVALRV